MERVFCIVDLTRVLVNKMFRQMAKVMKPVTGKQIAFDILMNAAS